MRYLLGISAYYHDAAAAILVDGEIIAAAQEERFSRLKNDHRFPDQAIAFCLQMANLKSCELDGVVFYDKPVTKFARILKTNLAIAPKGFRAFSRTMPSWLREKLNVEKAIRRKLPKLRDNCQILFTQHHVAHAASAFFPSPYENAAILTIDGVGEYATTSVGLGLGNNLEMLQELIFPHSLGLLYSAFTAYCGFKINSGEYKLMGLAPYGEPRFVQAIYDYLIDVKSDGSFWLNMDYFDFLEGGRMTNERFCKLFAGPPRLEEDNIEQRHLDVARSIQQVTEQIIMRLTRYVRGTTGQRNLCLAGGVALNCVANGLILREKLYDGVWIQPAAGDAGGALGAALAAWHADKELSGKKQNGRDLMRGALLGPKYSDAEIEAILRLHCAVFEKLSEVTLINRTAELLQEGKVVGWFQGRMEFGPRALGNRSILADARSGKMQSIMNLKIKFRESFRPFAPAVCFESVNDYFDLHEESPYMLLVAQVKTRLRYTVEAKTPIWERVNQIRSAIPAVTHVDYSARVQTVTPEQNPRFYALLKQFELLTGCGVLVNTSFNVRDEPIVCSPEDAYRCFMNTEMDYLVIGNYILERGKQPYRDSAQKEKLSSQRIDSIAKTGINNLANDTLLGLFFFLVLTLPGVILRLLGVDLLKIRKNHRATSYWKPADVSSRLDRPY